MDLDAIAIDQQRPLPLLTAWTAVGRCVAVAVALLAGRRVHLPRENVGMRVRFADGTSARVYRETVVDGPPPREPCVLLVEFRLFAVRGRGHTWFRAESLLNTPLFVGFPGLVTKLWLAHDQRDAYRGLYEWDGATSARSYARALWRVLALVSLPDSIHYRVLPGLTREELLASLAEGEGRAADAGEWWRPVGVDAGVAQAFRP